MFTKLAVVCAVVVLTSALEYPAGVHPAVCPNYPYCDLSTLARHTPEGIPIPEWELNPALLPTAHVVGAHDYLAKFPAGVHPAVCPNYPYCDLSTLARHTPEGIPIPEWELNPALLPTAPVVTVADYIAKYPADVHPSMCPNYPYCF